MSKRMELGVMILMSRGKAKDRVGKYVMRFGKSASRFGIIRGDGPM